MNIYWPVFKNLETEFSSLMYYIHVDENQLGVYSSKITDLILRAVVEIESISKELFFKYGGRGNNHIRYDKAIEHLDTQWLLCKKVVLISSPNCFLTKKKLYPFVKDTVRTGGNRTTFSWNNAYQNIKHDRGKSLEFGCIRYLFDAMAALYILNLYFADRVFELGKDMQGVSLSPSIGSDIFSVSISIPRGYSNTEPMKSENLQNSVYYITRTQESAEKFLALQEVFNRKLYELALQNPKVLQYLEAHSMELLDKWLVEALDMDEYVDLMGLALADSPLHSTLEFQAILNRNEL
jgi:hypothetical protein